MNLITFFILMLLHTVSKIGMYGLLYIDLLTLIRSNSVYIRSEIWRQSLSKNGLTSTSLRTRKLLKI